MKNCKKRRKYHYLKGKALHLLFVMLLLTIAIHSAAQGKSITGVVIDNQNEPIIGVSVSIDGTTNGTITDINGNFSLSNVPPNSKLQFSYLGYISQKVVVGNNNTLRITLIEDTQALDEVIVVGYGTQKKSDVTGAMVSVGADELKARPTTNVFEALQGKAAGVDIRTSDRPGEMGDVLIRGVRSLTASSSPLYVVDGVPLNST